MYQIINSILDLDKYKATMMNFVLELYPDTVVTYKFKNRGPQRFNETFLTELQNQINSLSNLKLTDEEYLYLKENMPYLTPDYIEYLKNFRLNPSLVSVKLEEDGNLDLKIGKGKWVDCILFETILMSLISEIYFSLDKNWHYKRQEEKAYEKIKRLSAHDCQFVEMGSRRRRSFFTQKIIIKEFIKYSEENSNSSFLGSSNIYFCMKYQNEGLKAYGSLGHEIISGISGLKGLRSANFNVMSEWASFYENTSAGASLTYLPDTFGMKNFLQSFNRSFAMRYKSIRHDSGPVEEFVDQTVAHFENLGIDPLTRGLIFSDSLNVEKCISIKRYCQDKINCSFGIGTELTNSFSNSPALNMVIKLWSIAKNENERQIPVVKLGNDKNFGKIMGDETAIKVARWTFFGDPLD